MAATTSEPIVLEDVADAVEAGEVLAGFSLADAVRSLWSVARRSPGLGRRAASLAAETTKILVGTDGVAPAKSDWRFRDDTWKENPAYRRLMQTYLTGCAALEEAVEAADIDWRDKERARFAAAILSSTVSPTNTLLGNPAAVKRAYETAGVSLLRGTRNFVKDVRSNRGMPSTVDRNAFTVGENLAATLGAVVYRDDICEVLQYAPTTGTVRSRPVLLVPPQISKFSSWTSPPGAVSVEHAVAQGLQFFVISWRNVTADQSGRGLDTYAKAIERALDVVRNVARSDDANLVSLCAGGITTATLLNHLASTGDTRVHRASFGVTLLDFDVPAPLGMFRMAPLLALARKRSSRSGVLDAASLSAIFSWMRPDDLVWNYWVNDSSSWATTPPAFDILAWNADPTNLAAQLHEDFLEIMQKNLLATKGELEVLGTPIDLEKVTIDTYVTGATTDHLTPWRGCYQTTQLMSGRSRFVLSNAGHIASLINPPGQSQGTLLCRPGAEG